jgi:hypothetical protein
MPGMKPLENVRDAFGDDLLSLITGHDVDADRRERNREIACSVNYKPTEEEMQMLLRYPKITEIRRRKLGPRLPRA